MWELLLRSRKFMIGLCVFVAILIFGIIGPMVTRNPLEQAPATRGFLPPSWEYPLGTDIFGEDLFAQLCTGTRNSMIVGAVAGIVGTLIAVLFGSVGPYKGGAADEISNFVTNVVIVFPTLPLLIVLAAILQQRSLLLVALLIGVTSWPWAARSIRGQVLSLKEREFVDMARMSGMSDRKIAIREILPNMLAYTLMVFVIMFGIGVVVEAGISIIGVGPNPGTNVTLGTMLYWARMLPISGAAWWLTWWWFVPPGVMVAAVTTSIFVMHSGMDEVFNPKSRKE